MVKKKTAKTKAKTRQVTKKEFTCKEKLLGLAELGRPIEWSKTLLNMTLAALMVYYIYLPIDVSISITFNIFIQIGHFISVGEKMKLLTYEYFELIYRIIKVALR